MNRPLLKRVVAQGMAVVAAAVLSGALALAQDASQAGGQRTDGQIEMDVVHALDASAALKNDLITAATIQSKVTLSGTVASDASKNLAESIVKGVPGGSGVQNNLKVGNPADDPNAQTMQPADDQGAPNEADNAPVGQGPQQDQQQPPPAYGQDQQQQPPAYGQDQQYPQNQQQYPQGQQPAYGQNQQYPQNQQPPYGPDNGQQQGYGQPPAAPPAYGQAPPPGYGQAPPPGYGQAGPPPQYPPQYGQRQPYNQAPPPPPYRYAKGPVTIPAGTLIQLRTSESVDSKHARGGEPVQFTVIQDVTFGGVLAIPRGATVHGVIADVRHAESGALTGSAELALQLTGLDLGGQTYPLESDAFRVKGPGKGERSAGNIIGGAVLGAIIGGAAGGGGGAAIGAAAGGTAGTAVSAAQRGPNAWIPAEALVTFHLATPITVNPVDPQEAARLAQGLYPGGPTLYRRNYYGRPGPYPYYYAPVYYRPYYVVGGAYYWR